MRKVGGGGCGAGVVREGRLKPDATNEAATARADAASAKPEPSALSPSCRCPSFPLATSLYHRALGQQRLNPLVHLAIRASRSLISIPAVSIGSPTRMLTVAGRMILLPRRMASRAARYRHRHDRRLRLERHQEAALLERQQFAGPAARAFGKDQERVAVADRRAPASSDRIAASLLRRSTGTKPPR